MDEGSIWILFERGALFCWGRKVAAFIRQYLVQFQGTLPYSPRLPKEFAATHPDKHAFYKHITFPYRNICSWKQTWLPLRWLKTFEFLKWGLPKFNFVLKVLKCCIIIFKKRKMNFNNPRIFWKQLNLGPPRRPEIQTCLDFF